MTVQTWSVQMIVFFANIGKLQNGETVIELPNTIARSAFLECRVEILSGSSGVIAPILCVMLRIFGLLKYS